jgi:hypothetical protein
MYFVKVNLLFPIWLRIGHISGFNNVHSFTYSDIILGRVDEYIIVNFVFLIVKFAIYNCKLKCKIKNFAIAKAYIKYVMKLDNYAASTNNTLDKCWGKWSLLFHSLK